MYTAEVQVIIYQLAKYQKDPMKIAEKSQNADSTKEIKETRIEPLGNPTWRSAFILNCYLGRFINRILCWLFINWRSTLYIPAKFRWNLLKNNRENSEQQIFQGCVLMTLTFNLRLPESSRPLVKYYRRAKFEKGWVINNREIAGCAF